MELPASSLWTSGRGSMRTHSSTSTRNRQAISDAESLGRSKSSGRIIPRAKDFALPPEPPAYDPDRARQLK